MEREKAVREPKQARSIQMKEKILDTAYGLFCQKGYYNTSTNEIARAAGVSIGSLYSYFADKDTIFMEILERYHQDFIKANSKLTENVDFARKDLRVWLRGLIDSLIGMHEIGKELNHELKILCYTKPEVAAVLDQHLGESRRITLECIQKFHDDIRYEDVEAAALITYDFMSAVIDGIVFGGYSIEKERIINACIEAIYRFLMNPDQAAIAGLGENH
jgi:AcrR family transcriptional regulator